MLRFQNFVLNSKDVTQGVNVEWKIVPFRATNRTTKGRLARPKLSPNFCEGREVSTIVAMASPLYASWVLCGTDVGITDTVVGNKTRHGSKMWVEWGALVGAPK